MASSPRKPDLLERLQRADRSMAAERMSRAGSRRVAKRISRELEQLESPSRLGWMPMLTFVAGAALVLLFLRWSTDDTRPAVPTDAARSTMTVQVTGTACQSHSGRTTSVWGACSLSTSGPSMRIDTVDATHLEVDDRVVHLRTGSALFDVDPVRGEPVRVAIPQGEIVVVGTRFRVIVSEGRSEVELYEGRLEFHDPSGQITPIVAGQVVAFGSPVAARPVAPPRVAERAEPASPSPATPTPKAPRKSAAPTPAPKRTSATPEQPSPMERDAGPVIEQAERLRRQGRYADAASVLRDALKRRWPTRTADVLSYELGRLLQRRVKDQASACEHWKAHLKRFASTRYRVRIERAMSELACDPSTAE